MTRLQSRLHWSGWAPTQAHRYGRASSVSRNRALFSGLKDALSPQQLGLAPAALAIAAVQGPNRAVSFAAAGTIFAFRGAVAESRELVRQLCFESLVRQRAVQASDVGYAPQRAG